MPIVRREPAPVIPVTRGTVFVAGGQPSITYIDRQHLNVEYSLQQALNVPNQIVSLAGPSKSGKTVLCRKVMQDAPHIWIEGGQIERGTDIWDKICYVLNYPVEVQKKSKDEGKAGISVGVAEFLKFEGSLLNGSESARTYKIDTMAQAIRHLREENIVLIIDDFHYLPETVRKSFLRNIKGPVFDGLKLVLLSVTHRGLDAVKAELELQGRVYSVVVPEWNPVDLTKIPQRGFHALNVQCPSGVAHRLTQECQQSPFLMQKLCWEISAGIGVDTRSEKPVPIANSYDLVPIFQRLSKDFGHPTYQKLEIGPQSRKTRIQKKLRFGGTADIYKAVLMAIAATGPAATITYDELRAKLSDVLIDTIPRKQEVTNALKLLAAISRDIGDDAGIDWDSEERKVDISDPYLRFYLRWQVRSQFESTVGGTLSQRLMGDLRN
ncbi:MAG: hypothetical protein Q8M24_18620 [Pseudolabrys sp.]|nr:hypothetical protein [Pseudolabrys sp.]MDP2297461.1 hypothetical protein [Pseudolabrys sp.]